jgi:uncharacterized membrane-anchored protein YitT (DUF2179 family)
MKEEWNDLWLGVLFFLVALGIYFLVIPREVYQMGGSGLTPRFFPSATALVIAGSSLCLVWVSWRKIRRTQEKPEWTFALFDKRDLRVIVAMAFLFTFVLIFKHFGFLVASIAILVPLIRFFGEKRLWLNVGVSVLVSVSVFFFFERALNIVLH